MTKVVVLGRESKLTESVATSLRGIPGVDVTTTDLPRIRRTPGGVRGDILVNCDESTELFPARVRALEELHDRVAAVYESLFVADCPTHVFFSSVDVYGDVSRPETTREELAGEAPPTLFGFHKREAEVLVERHAKRAYVLRLGTLIGAELRHNPLHDLLGGEPLHVSRHSRLSLLHVSFLHEVLEHIVTGKLPPGTYNVTGRGSIGIEEVARRAGRAPTEHEGQAPLYRYEINTDRLATYLAVPESQVMADRFLKHP